MKTKRIATIITVLRVLQTIIANGNRYQEGNYIANGIRMFKN